MNQQVNSQNVINSLLNQVTQLSQQNAIKDAMLIETQNELNELKQKFEDHITKSAQEPTKK